MTELLKLPHLVNEDRVTDMKIRRCRVEPGLDAQRTTLLQPLEELLIPENLVGSPPKFDDLLFGRQHVWAGTGYGLRGPSINKRPVGVDTSLSRGVQRVSHIAELKSVC